MSFKVFKPVHKGTNDRNTYTIQTRKTERGYFSGGIYINGGMRDALNLTQYTYVELFTDKDNQLIAIRPTNDKTEHIRTIRRNGSHKFITCSSWLYVAVTELGYPEKGSGSYKMIEGGLIVLEKPEIL